MDLTVKITRLRRPEEVLAFVKVPKHRVEGWARLAKGEAVMQWRRDTGDHSTSVEAAIIPALTLNLPARFYDDHRGRDLPSGVEESRNVRGTTVKVTLDREAYRDLLSDARFYVEQGTAEFGKELVGLISSARATVRLLNDNPFPEEV